MSACRWEPLMVQQLRQIIFHVLRKKITLGTLGFERHTCATRCSPAVTQSWAKSCSWLTVSEFSLHGCVVPWTWGEAMLRWAACDKENWLTCRHPGNRQQRRCQGQHISFQATQKPLLPTITHLLVSTAREQCYQNISLSMAKPLIRSEPSWCDHLAEPPRSTWAFRGHTASKPQPSNRVESRVTKNTYMVMFTVSGFMITKR